MEKRDKPRVLFKSTAEVEFNGRTYTGMVDNLNTRGMFVITDMDVPENEQVFVTIHLSGSTTELSIKLKATTIRKDAKGVALKFTEMELDCFVHLRNIVMYAASDPQPE